MRGFLLRPLLAALLLATAAVAQDATTVLVLGPADPDGGRAALPASLLARGIALRNLELGKGVTSLDPLRVLLPGNADRDGRRPTLLDGWGEAPFASVVLIEDTVRGGLAAGLVPPGTRRLRAGALPGPGASGALFGLNPLDRLLAPDADEERRLLAGLLALGAREPTPPAGVRALELADLFLREAPPALLVVSLRTPTARRRLLTPLEKLSATAARREGARIYALLPGVPDPRGRNAGLLFAQGGEHPKGADSRLGFSPEDLATSLGRLLGRPAPKGAGKLVRPLFR